MLEGYTTILIGMNSKQEQWNTQWTCIVPCLTMTDPQPFVQFQSNANQCPRHFHRCMFSRHMDCSDANVAGNEIRCSSCILSICQMSLSNDKLSVTDAISRMADRFDIRIVDLRHCSAIVGISKQHSSTHFSRLSIWQLRRSFVHDLCTLASSR